MCPMVNKSEFEKFILQNKSFSAHILELLEVRLAEEEEQLRKAAEKALLESTMHDSALLCLGRVSLLRETVSNLQYLLKEQSHG